MLCVPFTTVGLLDVKPYEHILAGEHINRDSTPHQEVPFEASISSKPSILTSVSHTTPI